MKLPVTPVKVHLGCGSFTPQGWINVDGSWNAWLAKWPLIRNILKTFHIIPSEIANIDWDKNILVHDVRKRLPFSNDSVDAIYSSHLLEHLYLIEAKLLLKECYKILKTNGILRLVVPNLKSIISDYTEQTNVAIDEPKADILNMKLLLRNESQIKKNIFYKIYTFWMDFHSHKWMYDAESLTYHMKVAGFAKVRECSFLESRIDDIHVIEKAERVLNGAGICIEGFKP